ncbi:hypothetical protein E2C01_092910 [Portunus trituberculatus]|uniref:Uncharacterized protein n=1 Tax=Portunus trituberculatus TaxID=210409 RepID=A0A5B7JHP9_PORTR|nr:hypothetical protein [Portunus trituberculatus]
MQTPGLAVTTPTALPLHSDPESVLQPHSALDVGDPDTMCRVRGSPKAEGSAPSSSHHISSSSGSRESGVPWGTRLSISSLIAMFSLLRAATSPRSSRSSASISVSITATLTTHLPQSCPASHYNVSEHTEEFPQQHKALKDATTTATTTAAAAATSSITTIVPLLAIRHWPLRLTTNS